MTKQTKKKLFGAIGMVASAGMFIAGVSNPPKNGEPSLMAGIGGLSGVTSAIVFWSGLGPGADRSEANVTTRRDDHV
jgi:hypothetical protein